MGMILIRGDVIPWRSSMSNTDRPKVPEGKSRFLITRQKTPNEKGFVGYETLWEPFQKEAKYVTPKRP
ncbi:MAG TPA: hypothetical protein PKH69_06460 [Thiobacillaceae bacterium]|nr:hypothetical protein [Thiobacillaceae bacterium]HNU63867.1 hypothetical protein [Thiobacillaceae bacterium]